MKNIKVVIGAHFGDEGKGLTTDYFCNQLQGGHTPILNVRFNGGAQCGHTVEHHDGTRHMFQHFGAGSFNQRVTTYLSPHFITNPIFFKREYDVLRELGIYPSVQLDMNCRITFPFDMMINQIVEKHRGSGRHGSCGVGIFETVRRSEALNRFTVRDALNLSNAEDYYRLCRETYVQQRLNELGVTTIDDDDREYLKHPTIFKNYMDDLNFMLSTCFLVDNNSTSSPIKKYDSIVFEGAQGLLLDQTSMDYFPNLTPSSTGMRNVAELLNLCDESGNVEICYVTRPYFTRHGAGKFHTECPKEYVNGDFVDLTNGNNLWQQEFRYGYFDVEESKKAINKDMMFQLNSNYRVSHTMMMTHLDETQNQIRTEDGRYSWEKLLYETYTFPMEKLYISHGPTRLNIVVPPWSRRPRECVS